MEKRILGKTKERLSIIGFGGIVVMNETTKDSSEFVSKAIDRGINYFDVAPQYGNAQEMMGPALKPYRKDVFLACKTLERLKKGAEKELHDSLRKLKTDYLDLYQFHGVITLDEVERIMGAGGAMEAFEDAKNKGLIRFIGFTAHTEEAALALLEQYDFSTILFPFNWASWLKDNFGPKVLEKASENNIGILALKALAKRSLEKNEHPRWEKCWYAPADDFEEAALGLRFTLSLPVTSAVSPSHAELLWWACDIADNLTTLSENELEFLRQKSKELNTITLELKNG
ncbi:MAG: aldo/keto reductase [Actinobacteria bacterium]|nr:aldo/keto reductase [Actinomycetota bacterium]